MLAHEAVVFFVVKGVIDDEVESDVLSGEISFHAVMPNVISNGERGDGY